VIARTVSGPIEYASAGTGPPLLLVHGASGGYDQGLLIGTAVAGSGIRVIAPSRFGYLGTPLPRDASAAAQADAHAALLDVLGVERAVVAGVSAGAPSAVQLALRHPDRVGGLVLLSPLGYAPESQAPLPGGTTMLTLPPWGIDCAYWVMVRLRSRSLLRLFGVPPSLMDTVGPQDREWLRRLLASAFPLSRRLAGASNDLAVRLLLRAEKWPLERIVAPTLILTCADDLYVTEPAARYAATHIPGARLIAFPTGGHLFIGHLTEVRETVAAFLKDVRGAGRPE
jgi:pimeloyl-ACP methyl ester carboxylesterase